MLSVISASPVAAKNRSDWPLQACPGSDSGGEVPGRGRSTAAANPREDLPYKVELWDDKKAAVEQVLAVTSNGSIGYAAYYAATREYPDRFITLRHKNSIVSRWNGPDH